MPVMGARRCARRGSGLEQGTSRGPLLGGSIAVDSHLNEVGHIIPELGDAGDKIFGTK